MIKHFFMGCYEVIRRELMYAQFRVEQRHRVQQQVFRAVMR